MRNKKTPFLLLFLIGLFLAFFPVSAKAESTNENKNGLIAPQVTFVDETYSSDLFTSKYSAAYSSDWEKYSSYYYYNQMSSAEKALYDKLNIMCLSYLEGTTDLSSGITQYVAYTGLKPMEAYNVERIFYYSNPQYYFLYPGMKIYYEKANPTNGRAAIQIYTDFQNGSVRKKATAAFKSKLDNYVKQVSSQSSLQAKEKKAHDLIVLNTTYVENSAYNQSAYSVFCKGKTVCAGYASAFSMLCNAVGIDTTIITSDTHAWNYIRLNDSWYNIDCTWDDLDGYEGYDYYYIYFNRNKTMLLYYDQQSAHVTEDLWTGYTPSCTLDSNATITSTGSLTAPSAQTKDPIITVDAGNGKNKITITSATKNATIYYTTDGSTPSAANTKSLLYTGSFTTTASSTIKAIAVYNTYSDSNVTSKFQEVILKYAATPAISSQPSSKTYAYGDSAATLSVKASISDSGTLSYQWYKNSKKSTSGAVKIEGAVKSSYTPSVSSLGTTYYFCIITNTNNKATQTKTATQTSSIATIKVAAKKIGKCSISSMKTKAYTGKAIKQSITVKNGTKTLKNGTDYKVTYKNNKAIGTATVVITGINNYTGKATRTFTINPKKITLKSVVGQSKKIKVSWNKNNTVTGYQIQYSIKSSFSSKKTVTIKKAKTTSTTISKLSSKKYYYVRVRGYKVVNGKTYYSSWSSVKKVKTK